MPAKTKALKIGAWEKMVANPGDNPPVRTPSINPYTGAVRNFKRSFTYTPDPDPASPLDFAFHMTPNVHDTFRVGKLLLSDLPAPDYFLSIDLGFSNDAAGYLPMSSVGLPTAVVGAPFGGYVAPESVIPGQGPDRAPVRFIDTVPAGTTFTISSNVTKPLAAVSWAGGVPTIRGVFWSAKTLIVTFPGNVDGWSFAAPNDVTITQTIPNVSIQASSGTWRTFEGYNLFGTEATTLAAQRVSTYRVTAMSMLVSCAASSLENGGVIAAARTRPGWHPGPLGTVYESLTRLQDHSYRGPVRDGAYVWWLPTDLSELDQRPFGSSPDEETSIWVAGKLDSRNASLQITIDINFEFYSPLQLFEHEVGPPLVDSFITAYHMLDALPAATCNPKHQEILKQFLKGFGATAKRVGRHLAANPELLAALLG